MSVWCADTKEGGLFAFPSAALGLVQIPFEDRQAGKPSYRDGLGSFKPSVGFGVRYWFFSDLLDAHVQVFYGSVSPAPPEYRNDYLWGITSGLGGVHSILRADLGFFNRRVLSNSDNVDHGFGLLLNIDLTSAGVFLVTQ